MLPSAQMPAQHTFAIILSTRDYNDNNTATHLMASDGPAQDQRVNIRCPLVRVDRLKVQ